MNKAVDALDSYDLVKNSYSKTKLRGCLQQMPTLSCPHAVFSYVESIPWYDGGSFVLYLVHRNDNRLSIGGDINCGLLLEDDHTIRCSGKISARRIDLTDPVGRKSFAKLAKTAVTFEVEDDDISYDDLDIRRAVVAGMI